jgi:uncharacterized membrane protein YeaQ/YmgE (transglycosylase-associated protein family)
MVRSMGIILFLVFGLIVGLLARALMPGRQKMGLPLTMALGCGGSLLGGFIGNAIAGREVFQITQAGFLGSLIGAFLILLMLSPMMRRRRAAL